LLREKNEILFGLHSVKEALLAQRRDFRRVYIAIDKKPGRLKVLVDLALREKIEVKEVRSRELSQYVQNDRHQGCAADVNPYPLVTFESLLNQIDGQSAKPFVLLLDQIVDPQNLGAIIRTAYCAGVEYLLVTKDRSALPTPLVSKVSAGAMEHMKLTVVTNFVRTIEELKKKGLWLAGLDQHAPQSIFEHDFNGATALVIGGEEKGLRPLVRKKCDFLVSIPQKNVLDSLNASVAGAIAMYEVFRQRNDY
jgi:23S rRNA (guanosine2251-2'-O)-methyltransferase